MKKLFISFTIIGGFILSGCSGSNPEPQITQRQKCLKVNAESAALSAEMWTYLNLNQYKEAEKYMDIRKTNHTSFKKECRYIFTPSTFNAFVRADARAIHSLEKLFKIYHKYN